MKFNKAALLVITLFTILSCSKFELVKTEEFKIDKNTFKKRIPITLVCTHGGKEIKNKKEYYYQTIAIDKETNDTITILSEEILAFDKMNVEQLEFVSVYSEDKSDLLMFEIMNNDKIEEIGNINDLKIKPYNKLDKVSFNNEFKEFDGRKYPAVIGLIVQSQNN